MKKAKWITATAMIAVLALIAFAYNAKTSALQQGAPPAAPPPATDGSRIENSSMQSQALGRELKFAIQLPPSYDKDAKRKFPVLYFLHGMNGNEGEFERRGVAAAINNLRASGKIGEMIIVAPGGKNSFYLNAKNGEKYEDAIIKDLIPFVEKTYRTTGTRDGRAIQGISMGGFGALVLAFKHPEMFSSVTTHCAALFAELPSASGTDQRSQFRARLVGNLFGDPPDQAFFHGNNPMDLADTNAATLKKSGLKIYFDVGDQDRYGFTQPNKDFDARLTKAGIAHEFHVFPGNHGWEYMISVADHSYGFLWNSFKGNNKATAKSAGN
jgi:S-formylglutathione hydrolase FrmB